LTMKEAEIEQFRQKMLLMRLDLMKLADTLKESGKTVELDQARVGRLSRMDAMQGQQMALEAARRRQHQLVDIKAALGRIESGKYGHCFGCGEAINLRRLAFDPTSTRCIDCAEE